MKTTPLWAGLKDTNDMRIDTSKAQRLWTQTQARPKQMVSEDSHQYQKSRKNHKGIKVTL
jgi:hypothetical protein